MEVRALKIKDVKIFAPKKFSDHRGFFAETYNKKVMAQHGITLEFVQDNHVLSSAVGTLRGLHFQTPPFAQDKLLRVVKGRVLDVAVDLRIGSPTYGQHVSAELSAEAFNQILVPIGFAHGCMALEPDTEFEYKVTNFYSTEHQAGLIWNDPDLGIDWQLPADKIVLSDVDLTLPSFRALESPFGC